METRTSPQFGNIPFNGDRNRAVAVWIDFIHSQDLTAVA